ncbi:HmuY family protein [Ekhidna sp.]|uniref:HmuY family protein n=1 Tax=Ekhidna sp. TaxID=2608089 RepID=UPI003C7D7777
MKTNMKRLMYVAAVGVAMLFTACGNDDGAAAPITLNFTNTEIGLSESVEVGITFSRPADADGSLTLQVISSSLVYGEGADFYTDPAMVDNAVSLSYEAGSESVSFMVFAGSALNIAQEEIITLTLTDADGFELGGDLSATITVSENFIANEGTLEIDGGGADFPNQAFIDLSKLSQTLVDKYSWDLGFYTASGEHHVVLNSSAYVMARPLGGETDLDEVTASDTVGFASIMTISNYEDTEASDWIDDQSGDLSLTAFGEISATANENVVFIIKRDGEGRNWKKVRVLQDGDNYILQYANIDATTHEEVTITKDAAYNFTHFDLDNGVVQVEPEKEQWDLMYSTYSGKANYGVLLAIGYNDYIISNRSDVSVAMVSTEDHAYDEFSADDLASLTFPENNISVIGSSWRTLVDFSLVLDESVFYVVKDSKGNSYKLKFTRLASEDGERGYPEFKIELL